MAAIEPPHVPTTQSLPAASKSVPPKPVDKKIAQRVMRMLNCGEPRAVYGTGKVKLIVEHESAHKVYWIPQASIFGMRRRNIEKEVENIVGIREGLTNAGVDEKTSNLAIDVTASKGVWESSKAEGNLEKQVSQPIQFSTRIQYARGLLNGMTNLHKAGYRHGDVKLENVLFYKDGTAKLADFDKSGKNDGVYTGNTRYGPPEGTMSQKGDVYGAAICLIRILEEHVLHNENRLPSHLDFKGSKIPPADKERRGVERFILECPVFTRSYEQKGSWIGKVLDFKARLQTILNKDTPRPTNPETLALNGYIKTLCERLSKAGAVDKVGVHKLEVLLQKMTDPNQDSRIAMELALDVFNTIFPEKL